MPIPRLALHSTDAGLDWATRHLILQKLGEPSEAALARLISVEALLSINELDDKLTKAYGWSKEAGWLTRSQTVRETLASNVRSKPNAFLWGLAWTALGMQSRRLSRVLSLPDAEFLAMIELSLRRQAFDGLGGDKHVRDVAYIFRKRRLPYVVADDGDISWIGEPEIARAAIEPALSALEDERLANARPEFADARDELRTECFDDAVNDAGKTVETTMACLLTAHGLELPRSKGGDVTIQAERLFDALKQNGIVDSHAKGVIMAVSPLRNAGSHGAGPDPVPLDRSDAEAAVASAAVAINYLAARMPRE